MKLQKLELNAFRGATQPFELDFDTSKKMTMIFGENGSGKSTIADAFTCLCTNSLGSIQEKSGHDKRYLASANCQNVADAKITLTTDTGIYTANFNGSNFTKNPEQNPDLRYLRRSQIVKLVDAQPAKRYEELQDFIDVEPIVWSEDGLRSLVRSLGIELSAQTRTLGEATHTIESAWQIENSPLADWRTWAKAESEKDLATEQAQIRSIQNLSSAWSDLTSKIQNLEAQHSNLKQKQQALIDLEAELAQIALINDQMNQDLLRLLQHAQLHIGKEDNMESCPLCEQTVDRDDLLSSIQQRLNANQALKDWTSRKDTASRNLSLAQSSLQNAQTQLTLAFDNFATKGADHFGNGFAFSISGLELSKRLELFESEKESIIAKISELEVLKQQSEKTIAQQNLIKTQYQRIVQSETKAKETEALLKAADEAFKIVETTRKKYIEDELDSISGEVDRMYQNLHPGEQIGSIRLTVKQSAKKSVNLSGSFEHLTDIAPQSLYSESHLDTLGICVFLALAKKYGSADTILILDDVVMSVDARHLDRFIGLLHDVAKDFSHILITTHYGPWRDRYRFHRAPPNDVRFVELRPWSLENGIRQQNGKIAMEELKEALETANFDRQRISNLAGVTLEALLDFITYKFQSKLPRKPGSHYTLGELLGGISSKLSKVIKVEHCEKGEDGAYTTTVVKEVMLKDYISDLKQLSAVRNQVGSHFNFDGSLVPDADVKAFGEKVLDLAELLTCPDSGALPDRDKSGSYWQTRNGSVRLYPLKEPAN